MQSLLRQGLSCLLENQQIIHQWNSSHRTRQKLIHQSFIADNNNTATSLVMKNCSSPSDEGFNNFINHFYDQFHSANSTNSSTDIFKQEFLRLFPKDEKQYHQIIGQQNSSSLSSSLSSSSNTTARSMIPDLEVPFGIQQRFKANRNKELQIRRMASIIRWLKKDQQSNVDTVVDVGGGTGLLAELMACDLGISTCVLEQDTRLIAKGRKQQSSKTMKMFLKRIERKIEIGDEISSFFTNDKNKNRHDDQVSEKSRRRKPNSFSLSSSSSSSVCLCGVHACGSLSCSVFLNAIRQKEARSFLIVPCCHHRKFLDHFDEERQTRQRLPLFFSETSTEEINFMSSRLPEECLRALSPFHTREALRLANLHNGLNRDEFNLMIRDFIFHHLTVLLFEDNTTSNNNNNNNFIINKILIDDFGCSPEELDEKLKTSRDLAAILTQTKRARRKAEDDRRYFGGSKGTRRGGENDDDTGVVAVQHDHDDFNSSHKSQLALSSFSSYFEDFAKTFIQYSPKKYNHHHHYHLSEDNRKILKSFFEKQLTNQECFTKLYALLHTKCIVEQVGHVFEASLFLDRVVTAEEVHYKSDEHSRKWKSLMCGSLFASSVSPRRFGVWGVKNDPILLLE